MSKPAPTVDMGQRHLNNGSYCFHIEDGRYCGRGERWAGHEDPDFHAFVPEYCSCHAPGGYPHEPDCAWWYRNER